MAEPIKPEIKLPINTKVYPEQKKGKTIIGAPIPGNKDWAPVILKSVSGNESPFGRVFTGVIKP